jgi:hypothetical protein
MNSIQLMKVHQDAHLLVQLSQVTFMETFGTNYTQADLDHYFNKRLSSEALGTELKNKENYFFKIITPALEPCGYAKITPASSSYLKGLSPAVEKPNSSTYLERFYLLKSAQGLGVAQTKHPGRSSTLDGLGRKPPGSKILSAIWVY